MSVGALLGALLCLAASGPAIGRRTRRADKQPLTGATRANSTHVHSTATTSLAGSVAVEPCRLEVVIVRASRLLIALGSSALLVGTALPAGASPLAAGPPVLASGPSPFAGCTAGPAPGPDPGTVSPNTEVEPFVAVNPTDPNNVIGVFQQDRWSNGGAHGLVASRSTNGGGGWGGGDAGLRRGSRGGPGGAPPAGPRGA